MDAGWIESAFIAVVISSLVTVAGWFMTPASRATAGGRAARRERIQDYPDSAPRGHPQHQLTGLQSIDLDRHLDEMVGR